MRFGNGGGGEELDVFITFSCRGMQKCVLDGEGYDSMGQQYDTSNADPFRVYIGFHGNSYDQATNVNIRYYAHTAELNGLGDAWLDYFYENNVVGSYDQCPTVGIWADSSTDATYQFNYGGLQDVKGVDGYPYPYFFKISGCDPNYGEQL